MTKEKRLRLDKILSHLGLATRSEAKKMARSGLILVNGAVVKDSSCKVDPLRDHIELDGHQVVYREHIYLMMNKPAGVISATEDDYQRTVLDLLSEQYRALRPFPVGRLDKDTEGLLLLTNDGQLSHQLLSPKKHVPKLYAANVRGRVDEADVEAFRRGVELDDGYVTMPAELHVLSVRHDEQSGHDESYIELQIVEGKFHQVKRMFQAVGKQVTYLKRLKMGDVILDPELKPGDYRELTETELNQLIGGSRR